MEQVTELEQAILIAALAEYRMRLWDVLEDEHKEAWRALMRNIAGIDRAVFTAERKFDGPPIMSCVFAKPPEQKP